MGVEYVAIIPLQEKPMATCSATVNMVAASTSAADNQAAVVAPGEFDPLAIVRALVTRHYRLLIGLIVINAEDIGREWRADGFDGGSVRSEFGRLSRPFDAFQDWPFFRSVGVG